MYDQRYQVKQFLCTIHGKLDSFNIYESGIPGWVLFKVLDLNGCEGTIEIAHQRKDLKIKLPRP